MDGSPLPDSIREQWPWRPRFARVNGWRMHYVDEGTGNPVVLLHGNPCFLYRDFVEPLTRAVPGCNPRHDRVWPLGEAVPGRGAQSRRAHREPDGAATPARSPGGDPRLPRLGWANWTGFGLSNPGRVAALVVMSTWAWPRPPAEFHTRIFPWRMMHAPLVGPYLLGRHNALVGRGIYLSVVDREKFRKRAQHAYEWVLPDSTARLLTRTWPRWIPLDATSRALERFNWLEKELAVCRLPTVIVWGREDDVFDHATFSARFKQLLPHAEGPHLVTGRHFLQEDSGPEIAALIVEFLARNRTEG